MKRIRLKDFVNIVVHRLGRLFIHLQVLIQYRCGLTGSYTPDPFSKCSPGPGKDPRDCIQRRNAILTALPDRPLTSLDVGCDVGFFTFAQARRGGLCIGIDGNRNAIMTARGLASIHNCKNAVFAEMMVSPEHTHVFPGTDVLICLSVFHHWVRYYGLEGAQDIMRALTSKGTEFIVFDTGQSDETNTSWASELTFMNPDPDQWIKGFLQDLGFPIVQNLGQFSSAVSPVPRHLYLASRSGSGD